MSTDTQPAPNCTATAYLTCPWLRGVPGSRCLNSCVDEPECVTGEPWEPHNAAGEPITLTEEVLDQIAIDRWEASVWRQLHDDIRANTCTPAELAAIRRQDEEDEAESDRLEAEQRARAITDNDPPF
jgi:hypothetical protein